MKVKFHIVAHNELLFDLAVRHAIAVAWTEFITRNMIQVVNTLSEQFELQ